jgi:hypothetical protein
MTKIKTSELTKMALRWVVAQCEYGDGRQIVVLHGHSIGVESHTGSGFQFIFRPDEDWSQGGPIIEREKLKLRPGGGADSDDWVAASYSGAWCCVGPTPLTAAMRCFVASKLGDEVDVPEELLA